MYYIYVYVYTHVLLLLLIIIIMIIINIITRVLLFNVNHIIIITTINHDDDNDKREVRCAALENRLGPNTSTYYVPVLRSVFKISCLFLRPRP